MASIPLMYAQDDCELGGKESIEVSGFVFVIGFPKHTCIVGQFVAATAFSVYILLWGYINSVVWQSLS